MKVKHAEHLRLIPLLTFGFSLVLLFACLTSLAQTPPITSSGLNTGALFIMPGGEGILYGDVPENEHVPLKDILSGRATIIDSIRVSYEPSGAAWWRSSYYYEARIKYLGGPGPDRYFSMTVVDAN